MILFLARKGRGLEEGIRLLPLLPVERTVMFPRSLIQVRLQDPSFEALIEDTLAGKRILGVACLKRSARDSNDFEQPAIYKTICLARLLEQEHLKDVGYNLWLEGSARAQIVREIKSDHYRIAKVEVMHDFFDRHKKSELSGATQELIELCEQLAEIIPSERSNIRNIIFTHNHPGILADTISFHLVRGVYEKQSILEERDILRRVRLVCVQIRTLVRRFTKQAYKDHL